MVFDGRSLFAIHPTRFRDFLQKNRYQHFVGHNLQFDFWSIHRYGDDLTKKLLWDLGATGRLHDSLCLDLLLQLGTGGFRGAAGARNADDTKIYPVGLGVLSEELGAGEIDKGDAYRLRFGELLGLSEAEINAHPEVKGFMGYALPDAIVTYRCYQKLRQKAITLMQRCGWSPAPKAKYEIRPDAVSRWGPLGELTQVRGHIALAERQSARARPAS
jgi:hypothetical protein